VTSTSIGLLIRLVAAGKRFKGGSTGSSLNHPRRHEAPNSGATILVVWPNNCPPKTVGHLDDGTVRNVGPPALKKDLEMSIPASPIGIPQQVAVG
jgi:hypothetical protein